MAENPQNPVPGSPDDQPQRTPAEPPEAQAPGPQPAAASAPASGSPAPVAAAVDSPPDSGAAPVGPDGVDSPLAIGHKPKEGVKWGVIWWTLSITAHGAVVAAVIYFTPLRDYFVKPTDHRQEVISRIPKGREKQMVTQLLAGATNQVRRRVEEQLNIAKELLAYRDKVSQRYFARATDEPKDALGSAGPSINVKLTGKTIPQLYDIAQRIEQTAHGYYRQFRTVELARLQGVSLSKAASTTSILVPTHPPLKAEIFDEIITSFDNDQLEKLQAEINTAQIEIGSMVAAQNRMLDMIKGIMGDDAGSTRSTAGGGGVWVPSDIEGGGQSPGRSDAGLFQGYTPADPHAFSHAWGEGIGPVTHKDEVFPIEKAMDLGKRLPARGRKLMSKGSENNPWLFIDSWYIVGPFPNPDREEGISRAFPPESSLEKGIDLDAVYIGWGGKPVKWEYRMGNALPIVPQQPKDMAIWYAYTEIFAEEAQERLCIFGSDDFGKCWLSGKFIWASGKTPHPWIPNRGTLKVKFQKGFNPVLFKLENAWGRTGFSMCVFLGEA